MKLHLKKLFAVTCLALCLPSVSIASIDPIRKIQRLDLPQEETMVRVPTAQVVLADYELIWRDFPELQELSPLEVDEWLLNQVGYISTHQLRQNEVNSPIAVEPSDTRTAYRPAHYGRAVVFDVGNGLIDAKGAGAHRPRPGDSLNGLNTTAAAFKEYIYEKLTNGIFKHYEMIHPSSRPHRTVGIYAVIDWGFNATYENGMVTPAGLLLRQAHDRFGDPSDELYNFLPPEYALEVENILRSYGVTSAGDSIPALIDTANIQGTKDKDLVDFETFFVAKKFSKELTTMFDPENFIIPADSPLFIQPDTRISCPDEIWNYRGFDAVTLQAQCLCQFMTMHREEKSRIRELTQLFFSRFEDSMKSKWFGHIGRR